MKKKIQDLLQYAIWIDQKKAIIACMNKAGDISIESLNSLQESHVRFPGETSNRNRLFSSTLDQQKKIQNRLQQLRKSFLKEVSGHLSKVGTVIIMGPAETKYELHKELEKRKIFSTARMEVKSADKMKLHEIKSVLKERIHA
jgi:hypothetical protein